ARPARVDAKPSATAGCASATAATSARTAPSTSPPPLPDLTHPFGRPHHGATPPPGDPMTHQTDRLEAAVYNALRDFQQTADWPQLRLAQMRHHLAEHIARDLTLTPGALPATPDGISARDLAHALDNSTPYPVELTSTVAGFMAERLLEMLTIAKRDEHPVWQPEEQPEPGPQPQPEDPAALADVAPAAVPAAVAPPTDRAAVRHEADWIVEHCPDHGCVEPSTEVCHCEIADRLRRMADETATEPPQPSLRERHRAAWHALTPDQQTARLAELDEPAAGARQDGAPDDVVTELTEAEFHDAAGKALARLGLTYAELEDQARRRDFSSAQARSLWVTIGGAAPAGARQDEPVVTVHTAPDLSPAAEDALGALIDVAKQQATEGWRGATEVISDAEVQRLAATGLVGYRQGRGQLLHCLHHKPVPASRWADFHEVTSDDLPDGGICVHPRCGADLLAVQPAAREDGGAQ